MISEELIQKIICLSEKKAHRITATYTPAKGKKITKNFSVNAKNPKEAEMYLNMYLQSQHGVKTKVHRARHHKEHPAKDRK